MLTARRLHERERARVAGEPEPAPRRPDSISTNDHDKIVADINRRHADELEQARAGSGKGVGAKLKEALAQLDQMTKERDEALEKVAQLEQVTKEAAAGAEAAGDAKPSEAANAGATGAASTVPAATGKGGAGATGPGSTGAPSGAKSGAQR